jgi:hypothetical protein
MDTVSVAATQSYLVLPLMTARAENAGLALVYNTFYSRCASQALLALMI